MSVSGLHEPYIAVNARTGVPAGVGVAAVIHPHGYHIVAAAVQPWRQVIHERSIAAGPLAEQTAVEIDAAAVVHTFEIYEQPRGVADGTSVEMLPVPCDPAGKVSGAAGQRRRRQALDGPVVRQLESPPAAVIVSDVSSPGEVSEAEFPIVVEFRSASE